MTIGFKQQINRKPNYFIEKIWASISPNGNLIGEYLQYLADHESKFGKPWDFYSRNQDPVELGLPPFMPKLHTIRADPKNRWQANKLIHPVINNRTANRFQFAPVMKCVSVQTIEIIRNFMPFESHGEPEWMIHGIYIDGLEMNKQKVYDVAINDGFDSVEDFFKYFKEDFTGKIIHWTNLKY